MDLGNKEYPEEELSVAQFNTVFKYSLYTVYIIIYYILIYYLYTVFKIYKMPVY